MRCEYAFVNQYAYTHRDDVHKYTHRDRVIGHFIGTDADDLWINLNHWFTDRLQTSVSYELERHGEGNVNTPHTSDDPDEWEFLSGVTESTHSISIGASYNLIGRYSVDLKYTRKWIKNVSNQPDVSDCGDQVLLSGQYRF